MPLKLLDSVISALRTQYNTVWEIRHNLVERTRNMGVSPTYSEYVGDAYLEDVRNNPQSSVYPCLAKAWQDIKLPY